MFLAGIAHNRLNVPKDTVVVDTGNYCPRQRDGRVTEIEAGLPESRWVEQKIGHPVVKAFNNIYVYAKHLNDLGRPKGAADRIALPIAGRQSQSEGIVLRLVDELGFDGVDASRLDESWRQQPGTSVCAQDFDAAGVHRALEQA